MLLDTNVLILLVRSRFPLTAEVGRLRPGARVAVPSSVASELDRLARRGVAGARAAVELARTFPTVEIESRGDRAVLDAAVRHRAWVVTADRGLTAQLRRAGVPVLVPRDRHRLELRPPTPLRGPPSARTRAREGGRRRQRL